MLVIIIVSLFFLFLHIGRPLNVLFTTILFDSFLYSLVYYKTKNLAAPIIAHAISNFFLIIPSLIFL